MKLPRPSFLSVLKPPPAGDGDKSPFVTEGTGASGRAALCLHGFTGTPFEVRPLATHLADQGYAVSAPLLAGHGADVDALARTRWPDWLASAERALADLRARTGNTRVMVAGFSMGGLLALRLARLHPDHVAALAVLSAPLRLRPLEVAAVRAITRLPRLLRRGPLAALPKSRGFDVTDAEMQLKIPSLTAMPFDGVSSLIELGRVVRRDLPFVRQPVLVGHGELDHTVPLEDSFELAGTIASAQVERMWLPRSGHLILLDVERRTAIDTIGKFFARQATEAAR